MNNDIFFPDTNSNNVILDCLSAFSHCFSKEFAMALITILLFCQPVKAEQSTFEYTNFPVIVMTSNGDMTTVSENNGLRMWDRINELSQLKAGWDGEGSEPMKKGITDLLQNVISKCDDSLLNNWVLFPDYRGFLYLNYTNNKDIAGITVTESSFVYFIKKNGRLEKKDDNILTEEALINILKKVND
ncbi:hypothetical protein [Bacteroides fluxus]|uniref:hypothetical protein n=1 Tax=Bacteroides fluxus TaxID=626930 RepID=UPI002352496F|nr:hypothetical protein [Bacteroides fluxus]